MKGLKAVREVLEESKKYNLEAEVIYFAIKYMQRDPKLTVSECVQMAMDEWVK